MMKAKLIITLALAALLLAPELAFAEQGGCVSWWWLWVVDTFGLSGGEGTMC